MNKPPAHRLLSVPLFMAILLCAQPGASTPKEVGTVVSVNDASIQISLSTSFIPRNGSNVRVLGDGPGKHETQTALCTVNYVRTDVAYCRLMSHAAIPQIGQRCVMTANSAPYSPPAKRQVAPPAATRSRSTSTRSSKQGQQATPVHRQPSRHPNVSGAAANCIRLLRSSSAESVRKGAQMVVTSFSHDRAVLDVVLAELEEGYNKNSGDPIHVDAMAWLCKAIGASGFSSYRAPLLRIRSAAREPKIRRYAGMALRTL